MGYQWQRWMAEEYRAAGLTVVEISGWQNRGRPASTGNFDPDGPETVHHTGSTASPTNPRPSLAILIQGRSDLPGPLCQKATDYDGTVILIAAGRANHAGPVGKSGVPGMPLGSDGNARALGNEVMTDGTQRLTDAQRRSIAIQAAVDLKHFGRGPEYAHRHEDISGSGKWDLGSLTTPQLRADVAAELTRSTDPEETFMASTDAETRLTRIEDKVDDLLEAAAAEKQRDRASWKREQRIQKLAAKTGKTADQILDELEARA